jgi:hypothetical protein
VVHYTCMHHTSQTHSRFLDSLAVANDSPKVAPMMRMHTKACGDQVQCQKAVKAVCIARKGPITVRHS